MPTPKRMTKANAGRMAAVNPVMKGGIPRALGIRIVSLTRKKVIGEMRVKPIHLNHNGRVNGGAIMAFANVFCDSGASGY